MEQRVALITGASRGIGQAIARELAAAGFFVIGSATSAAGAASIDAQLGEKGAGIELRVDDADSISAALDQIKASWASPLVLINNAGLARDNLILRMQDDQWDDVVNANLTGVFRLCKPLLRPMMKARWGRIVNISSVVARMGNAGQTNYAASKAGLEGFTRALAQEVGSRSITVNTIAPGFIATDMTAALTQEQQDLMLARVPMGRMGEATEIGHLAAFLVGDNAGYITGETIHINGGLYMA